MRPPHSAGSPTKPRGASRLAIGEIVAATATPEAVIRGPPTKIATAKISGSESTGRQNPGIMQNESLAGTSAGDSGKIMAIT